MVDLTPTVGRERRCVNSDLSWRAMPPAVDSPRGQCDTRRPALIGIWRFAMRRRLMWTGATLGVTVIIAAGILAITGRAQQGGTSVEWPSYSADPGSTKYSPLDDINS